MPENIAFFTQYSDYFAFNSNLHHYQISYSGSIKMLVMTNGQGDQAFYNSAFLKTEDQTAQSKGMGIYPNPVKEGLVYFKSAEKIEWIKIYNAEGKLILQDYHPDAKINVSNLLKGGYFMEVKSQSGISRHRLTKG